MPKQRKHLTFFKEYLYIYQRVVKSDDANNNVMNNDYVLTKHVPSWEQTDWERLQRLSLGMMWFCFAKTNSPEQRNLNDIL